MPRKPKKYATLIHRSNGTKSVRVQRGGRKTGKVRVYHNVSKSSVKRLRKANK